MMRVNGKSTSKPMPAVRRHAGQHVTAGASGAAGLDDRIMEIIKGDAFDRAREDELLRKGWK